MWASSLTFINDLAVQDFPDGIFDCDILDITITSCEYNRSSSNITQASCVLFGAVPFSCLAIFLKVQPLASIITGFLSSHLSAFNIAVIFRSTCSSLKEIKNPALGLMLSAR